MSLGPLTTLTGVIGTNAAQVVDGGESGEVIIFQNNKASLVRTDDSNIVHTWKAERKAIVSVLRNQDLFEDCSYLFALSSNEISKVSKACTRLESFQTKKLKKDIFRLMMIDGKHCVVFRDGSVGDLRNLLPLDKYLMENEPEEEVEEDEDYSPGVLLEKEELLDAFTLDDAFHSLIFITSVDNDLHLLKLRSSNDGSALRMKVCQKSELLSWNLWTGTNPYMVIWKKSGELMKADLSGDSSTSVITTSSSSSSNTLIFKQILSMKGCTDTDVAALSSDHIAILYTGKTEDRGSVSIVSTNFGLVSSTAKLKTSGHNGRALHALHGHLFLLCLGKVSLARIDFSQRQLESFLGFQMTPDALEASVKESDEALSLYLSLPKLYKKGDLSAVADALIKHYDTPDDLVVDFLAHVTDPKREIESAERVYLLRPVLCHCHTDVSIISELSRLNFDQALGVLEVVCACLADAVVTPEEEEMLLTWTEFLLGNHYVDLVLSKDDKSLRVMTQMDKLLSRSQETIKENLELESTASALDCLQLESPVLPNFYSSVQMHEI